MVDFSTVVGILVGIAALTIAVLLTISNMSEVGYYISPQSLIIVLGGSMGAIMINFPFSDLSNTFKVVSQVFRYEVASPENLIEQMRTYAEIARRDGILALETVTTEADDEFLIKGIQLAVDGTDPEHIKDMMDTELDHVRDRHDKGQKIFENLAKYSPAFGMIGTLIGLISMLANLEDISQIGKGMAVALITTLYGAIFAYLFFGPMAEKLKIRSQQEMLTKEMIIRGVISIQSGDNPRIVEQKLKIFLSPARIQEYEAGQ